MNKDNVVEFPQKTEEQKQLDKANKSKATHTTRIRW